MIVDCLWMFLTLHWAEMRIFHFFETSSERTLILNRLMMRLETHSVVIVYKSEVFLS